MINWSSILEGTSAGIAGALLLGLFAISRNHLRNLILRFRIRRSFRRLTFGSGINGVTLGVSNHLRRRYRIREGSINTSERAYRLNPTGSVKTSFTGQHPKLTKKQKSSLKEGPVKMMEEMQYGPWKTTKTPEGFIEVEPFTSQEFLLPVYLVQHIDAPIEAIQFLVEYDNYTGGVDIMKVDAKEGVEHTQKVIDYFKNEMSNGSLNRQRSMAGLKPIEVLKPEQNENLLFQENNDESPVDKKATLRLPNQVEIELSDFDLTLGELIAISNAAFNDPRIVPQGFGATNLFFFVNATTGSLIDSLVDLRRPLSTLFINEGDTVELRLCQPLPQADGRFLNPMWGVTKFVK